MNEEHVRVVLQGAEAIRRWRERNPDTRLDLREADLTQGRFGRADLRGAVLHRATPIMANLRGADLSEADLGGAVLHRATLVAADLRDADLSGADLSGAVLRGADLLGANLRDADLSGADLGWADLRGAALHGAHLTGVILGRTTLGAGIAPAAGLDQMVHEGPSYYHPRLLTAPGIPEVFLRGIGVPQMVIDMLPALRGDPIQRFSCFISYSHADDTFAERLYADLYAKGVPVWKDSHDLKIGAKTREVIYGQIQVRDRTVVILSEASMASDWVESEVEEALAREREDPGTTVLFPVRIDDAIKTSKVAWASDLWNRRNVGDFTQWADPAAYAAGLDRVLKDLVREGSPTKDP